MKTAYRLIDSDPFSKKIKREKGATKAMKINVKQPKTTNIHDMSTRRIVGHLVYKHRVGILVTLLVTSWAWFIVTGLPGAMHNALSLHK